MARSGMQTLIRLHRWQLDELRRRLAPLESEREILVKRGLSLLESLDRERHAVAAGNGTPADLQSFKDRVMFEHERIGEQLARIEQSVEQLREQMAEAFQDVKKFEITEERRRANEHREMLRRDQLQLDEIGLSGHFRRGLEDSKSDP
tara:strand:+ start:305 stop:748 length:444 start_codon:yes stop_codon:yes gene_type:complete